MNKITKHVYQDWKIDAQQCDEDREFFGKQFTAGNVTLKLAAWPVEEFYRLIGEDMPPLLSVEMARDLCAGCACDMISRQPTRTWADMSPEHLRIYIRLLLCAPDKRFIDFTQAIHDQMMKSEH